MTRGLPVEKDVVIATGSIELDALLKWSGAALTGGEAKQLVQSGRVTVNGRRETRRSRKIVPGDSVSLPDLVIRVRAGK